MLTRWLVEGEEVRQGHGDAFEQFLEGADGGADAILFDQGDGGIGDAATAGQLALGQFVAFAY